MNPYEILGIPKTATADDIKKAYRKLASQHHPDKGGDTAKFQEIQTAYDTLSDPNKRAAYDNPQPRSNHFEFNFGGDLNDIFAQFGFPGGAFRQPQSRKNSDVRAELTVGLSETLADQSKTINLKTQSGEKNLDIHIPRGITSGTTIKYPGLGDSMFTNLSPGDLYLTVNVLKHPSYQVQGLDLIHELTIDCFQAILGSEQTIVGLDGKMFTIRTPESCQPDLKLKIPGEGLYAFQKDIKGSLLIKIKISIPSNLSEDQKNLIKQIQQHR
jgi:curved DNA-binding protein